MPTLRLSSSPLVAALAACLVACSSVAPASPGGAGGTASSSSSATTTSSGSGGASAAGGSGGASTAAPDAGGDPWSGPLPEGASGLAAKHPGDVGIGADPAVIFADDFETYGTAAELWGRWDNSYQVADTAITTDPANVFDGKQALELTIPHTDVELANAVDKVVSPERDVLFLRYYSKFEAPYDVIGSSHNGSYVASHYFVNGQATPGVPADGKNKFLAGLEDWRGEVATPSPGPLNIYAYHPEQRSEWGDHLFPTGEVLPYSSQPFDFGPTFVPRPDVTPALGEWACYEVMVKANTPGKRDGRIAFWFDGKLTGDFPNLRLRDVPSLTIDRFGLMFHAKANPNGPMRKWYDAVVAATSYVGPRAAP